MNTILVFAALAGVLAAVGFFLSARAARAVMAQRAGEADAARAEAEGARREAAAQKAELKGKREEVQSLRGRLDEA